jgi:hypothetical protein
MASVMGTGAKKGSWAGGAWKDAARPGVRRGRPVVGAAAMASAGEALCCGVEAAVVRR